MDDKLSFLDDADADIARDFLAGCKKFGIEPSLNAYEVYLDCLIEAATSRRDKVLDMLVAMRPEEPDMRDQLLAISEKCLHDMIGKRAH